MKPNIDTIHMQKKVIFTNKVDHKHWVGDGFNVYGLLRPYENINKYISPFIMLDYASPKEFPKQLLPRELENTLIEALKLLLLPIKEKLNIEIPLVVVE